MPGRFGGFFADPGGEQKKTVSHPGGGLFAGGKELILELKAVGRNAEIATKIAKSAHFCWRGLTKISTHPGFFIYQHWWMFLTFIDIFKQKYKAIISHTTHEVCMP